MSDTQLGMLAPSDADRDATHVATVPMIAATEMEPGTHCGVDANGRAGLTDYPIGIVDPFLTVNVRAGDRFYLCLYPRTITGLRHVYTHPVLDRYTQAADEHPAVVEARRWLREFGDDFGLTYTQLMNAANAYNQRGEQHYLSFDTPSRAWDDAEQFWRHYQLVTGATVKDNAAGIFRCAC